MYTFLFLLSLVVIAATFVAGAVYGRILEAKAQAEFESLKASAKAKL